ncbi:MAG TPA: nitroreductase/quinone reductase family protein [Anaerolineales bacterium]|nr:nitroreductase/quinone reductase family protein [Anaerolineales bacterium]
MNQLNDLKHEEYCYLTTMGRITGKPHEIEIWFGLNDFMLYLLSGGGIKSDWVKNLLKVSNVSVRIADRTFLATARMVKEEKEESMARILLADKYKERESDGSLSEWARTALVVGIKLRLSSTT